MEGTDFGAARSPSARVMPIDTTVRATRVESASASVANSSTGLVGGLCVGLVNMANLRESGVGICREALSGYRRAFVRTWAKPLMNGGDFVNLVKRALTSWARRVRRGG